MLGNIVKKLLTAIPVLLVVSIVLFVLLNALPGDAADALAAADASPEEIAALREELGLNDPAVVRYFKWISGVVKGDFGKSLISGKPVTDAIVQRFPVTLELTLLAMIVAILIALPMGIASATHRNSFVDYICTVFAMIGQAVPHFWLGMLLVLFCSVYNSWLPASGYVTVERCVIILIRMIMPAFAIGFSFAASVMRQTRSAVLDVLDQDYISTAKAKGLPGRIIVWKHALKNAPHPRCYRYGHADWTPLWRRDRGRNGVRTAGIRHQNC